MKPFKTNTKKLTYVICIPFIVYPTDNNISEYPHSSEESTQLQKSHCFLKMSFVP